MDSIDITTKAQELRTAREAAGKVVLSLERPSSEAQQALRERGGVFLRTWEETWCHSDTCGHQSHDAGTDGQEWEVPQSWRDAASAATEEDLLEVFPGLVERDSVYAIIPAGDGGSLLALCHRQATSYAGETYLVPARESAATEVRAQLRHPTEYKRAAEARARAAKLVAKMILGTEDSYDLGRKLGEERHDLISKLADLRKIAEALRFEPVA